MCRIIHMLGYDYTCITCRVPHNSRWRFPKMPTTNSTKIMLPLVDYTTLKNIGTR